LPPAVADLRSLRLGRGLALPAAGSSQVLIQ
jgi:hypothetical protein